MLQVTRVVGLALALGVAVNLACAGCAGGKRCFSDSECDDDQVCNRSDRRCEDPPGPCNDYCVTRSNCGAEPMAECIKSDCGASFQSYGEEHGAGCEAAWLVLMDCLSKLTCIQYADFNSGIDPAAGTAPYCQNELQARIAGCGF